MGGGEEPLFRPSADPERDLQRVIYREDYFASALHEVAHWCLAGARRRELEDYGYWYSPDGRSAEEQTRFELAEVEPQALEWIFSEACDFEFNLSVDNLVAGLGSSGRFEMSVEARRDRFLAEGLPARAAAYRRALAELTASRSSLSVPRRRVRSNRLSGTRS